MRVHIIGKGIVGQATGEGFRRFGHEVVYTDQGDDHTVAGHIHFICTPEDTVLGLVQAMRGRREPIIIRSTVAPGTTSQATKRLGRPLWHNPEFLQQATAEQDFLFRDYAIVGGPAPLPEPLLRLYQDMGVKVYACDALESEYAKLILNAYFAMQVCFWNELKEHLDTVPVNSHKVARLVALDERVSKHAAYMHGHPYGGRCLPKDMRTLLAAMGDKAGLMSMLDPERQPALVA